MPLRHFTSTPPTVAVRGHPAVERAGLCTLRDGMTDATIEVAVHHPTDEDQRAWTVSWNGKEAHVRPVPDIDAGELDDWGLPYAVPEPRREHAPSAPERVLPRVHGHPDRQKGSEHPGHARSVHRHLHHRAIGDGRRHRSHLLREPTPGAACPRADHRSGVRPGVRRPTWVYPRTGGGTASPRPGECRMGGLSPHGRGNPHEAMPPHNPARSIPARAGEPRRARKESSERAVYPRTGGGTAIGTCHLPFLRGLSPHGRGNPALSLAPGERRRSIPAREGEPRSRSTPRGASAVYPRTGGGTDVVRVRVGDEAGLSPHGRGNRHGPREARGPGGSIPARAGEPASRSAVSSPVRVYPRTGGGTLVTAIINGSGLGLSPHGRGNRGHRNGRGQADGSIPARAGEPDVEPAVLTELGVYPRTGGGTVMACRWSAREKGLSPHGRGNRWMESPASMKAGSIPARAGEPAPSRRRSASSGVYPRTGGGTRGFLRGRDPGRHRVYPRTGGGTVQPGNSHSRSGGLSPHGRGNLHPGAWPWTERGSIPARAGEPHVDPT